MFLPLLLVSRGSVRTNTIGAREEEIYTTGLICLFVGWLCRHRHTIVPFAFLPDACTCRWASCELCKNDLFSASPRTYIFLLLSNTALTVWICEWTWLFTVHAVVLWSFQVLNSSGSTRRTRHILLLHQLLSYRQTQEYCFTIFCLFDFFRLTRAHTR